MNISLHPDSRLAASIGALAPSARAEVEHAGAYALAVLVRRHVNRYARSHHKTAEALGAPPTRHLEDGSATVVCDGASVAIPIPGYSRALHDLDVRPTRAKALTIPISPVSYGVRAGRLTAEGWKLYRVGARGGAGRGILFGRRAGEKEATALYLLRASARVPQDRSMLPTDEAMAREAAGGVARAILRRAAT